MKPLACTLILLFACTFFSVQPVRYRVSAQGVVSKNDDESEEESNKRISECEKPDRLKPKGEIRRVSQLCGHAMSVPKPPYPDEAKAKRVSGTVVVDIVTNEQGRVVWAKASSGPSELRSVSEKAACRAWYSPTVISGKPIQTESSIQYAFVFP